MITEKVDHGTVRSAIELASRAPSVHNSQPWRWRLDQRSVHLYSDLRRWLPATDADGRDLVVSCGAALHHLRVALAASGVRTAVHRIPNPDEADHLAAVEMEFGAPSELGLGLASAIPLRRTDRRPFGDWAVPDAFRQELVSCAAEQGAVLRMIDEPGARAGVMAAIREAATIQAGVPGYPTELALWSGRDANDDGIPAANLIRNAAGTIEAGRRFADGDIEVADGQPDGATLAVLGTASDDRLSQLRAGEALSAILLLACDYGLAACPLSQPLEVGATRRTLRDKVLGGTLSPQLVLRLGWPSVGAPLPATPRRPVAETIEFA